VGDPKSNQRKQESDPCKLKVVTENVGDPKSNQRKQESDPCKLKVVTESVTFNLICISVPCYCKKISS
jgi:hypothetical protein